MHPCRSSRLPVQKPIAGKALFLMAPALVIVALTLVLVGPMLVAVGVLFSNALKTFKALFPPQNVSLSPVQGVLQSV